MKSLTVGELILKLQELPSNAIPVITRIGKDHQYTFKDIEFKEENCPYFGNDPVDFDDFGFNDEFDSFNYTVRFFNINSI